MYPYIPRIHFLSTGFPQSAHLPLLPSVRDPRQTVWKRKSLHNISAECPPYGPWGFCTRYLHRSASRSLLHNPLPAHPSGCPHKQIFYCFWQAAAGWSSRPDGSAQEFPVSRVWKCPMHNLPEYAFAYSVYPWHPCRLNLPEQFPASRP